MSKLAAHVEHFKRGAVGSLGAHNWYKRGEHDQHSNQDIDTSRSCNNFALRLPEQGLYREVKSLVEGSTGRVTANSVWVSEWVVYPPEELQDPLTADPERLKQYFGDVLTWMDENGYKVPFAVVHMDETTVHMQADTVPLTADGRLSRKDVYTRSALNEIHTGLAKYLAERGWDIQRGESTKDKQVRAKSVPEFKKDAEQKKLDVLREVDEIEDALNAVNEPVASLREVGAIDDRTKVKKPLWGSETVTLSREDYDKLKGQAEHAAAADVEIDQLRRTVEGQRSEIERLNRRIDWLEKQASKRANELNDHMKRINELDDKISEHEGLLARIGSWVTGKGRVWKQELDDLYDEYEKEWEAWHRAGNEMMRADNAIRKIERERSR